MHNLAWKIKTNVNLNMKKMYYKCGLVCFVLIVYFVFFKFLENFNIYEQKHDFLFNFTIKKLISNIIYLEHVWIFLICILIETKMYNISLSWTVSNG